MSDLQIEVINPQTEDSLTGIVIEGIPYLYWLRVYKALGLTSNHARKIIERLQPQLHYISFSNHEFKDKYPTVYKSYIVDYRASVMIFLTAEGYHRSIMEIGTGHISDQAVATAIDKKKDEIANIFTRYQSGETLSITDEHLALPGQVASPPVDKILSEQMGIAKVMIGVGVEPSIAHTMAFSVTESICNCGETLTPWKNLIKTDPLFTEPALLTPTDIGKDIGGLSARSVNILLTKFGYQEKIGSEWVPTIRGKMHSRLVPQEIRHNRGMVRKLQIKWQPSIIEKLREQIFYDQKGQTGLFVGEVGV